MADLKKSLVKYTIHLIATVKLYISFNSRGFCFYNPTNQVIISNVSIKGETKKKYRKHKEILERLLRLNFNIIKNYKKRNNYNFLSLTSMFNLLVYYNYILIYIYISLYVYNYISPVFLTVFLFSLKS